MRLPWMRWLFTRPAAIFYSMVAEGIYEAAGSPAGGAAVANVFAQLFLTLSVAGWVLADARKRRCELPYDYGTFLFYGAVVLAPIYLFQTRGWRAFGPLGYYVLLWLGAALVTYLLELLHFGAGY